MNSNSVSALILTRSILDWSYCGRSCARGFQCWWLYGELSAYKRGVVRKFVAHGLRKTLQSIPHTKRFHCRSMRSDPFHGFSHPSGKSDCRCQVCQIPPPQWNPAFSIARRPQITTSKWSSHTQISKETGSFCGNTISLRDAMAQSDLPVKILLGSPESVPRPVELFGHFRYHGPTTAS